MIMQELTIEARLENLDLVNDFVQHSISNCDCSKKSIMQLGVIVEEIFVNIVSYAYPEKNGQATIQTEIQKDPLAIALTFIDRGVKYNPLQNEDPDLQLSVEERGIGGLGIYLVKNMVEEISYKYEDGKNILSLKKKL